MSSYSLPYGPICSSTLNGIDRKPGDALWDEYLARNGNIIVAVKAVVRDDLNEISDAEMAVIEEIWDEFAVRRPRRSEITPMTMVMPTVTHA